MEDTMRVIFPGGKKVDAEYKGFLIRTDQPVHKGGEGTAPAPFDLFLASIATCSGIYVLSFCQNRGISLEDAFLTMQKEIDPQTKKVKKLVIEIHLPGDFPEKYRQAVIKAVNGCAVKVHLQDPPEFEVSALIGT